MVKIKKGQQYLQVNNLNIKGNESLRLKSIDKHITLLNFSFQKDVQLPDDPGPIHCLFIFKIPQTPLYVANFH